MHQVAYLLDHGFQTMALASQTVFELANLSLGETFYSIKNYSITGGAVTSSMGLTVNPIPLLPNSSADTWFVTGTLTPLTQPAPNEILSLLAKFADRDRRVASICTGSFVLAASGLLNEKRATTHWAFIDALQQRFPSVKVEPDPIFITADNIWTSAGMTAGLDMALSMIEKDLGDDHARSVAHNLVMHQRRTGGQTQHSELLNFIPKSDRIQNAINFVRQNLKRPLTVELIADAIHLSPRQFSRIFRQETGESPAKVIEKIRLEAARLMIERSRHSMEEIARETGFRDRRHMREVFMRGYGVPPKSLRREITPS